MPESISGQPVLSSLDETLSPDVIYPTKNSEEYLKLSIGEDIRILLLIQNLNEVLTIPIDQVIPMPHMAAWVMGIYNRRGEILWMVDLGHLCGFEPWYQRPIGAQTHNVVVLENIDPSNQAGSSPSLLGLVVSHVEDIEPCLPELIHPPPMSIPNLTFRSLLQGCRWNANGDMAAVLDATAIFAKMSID